MEKNAARPRSLKPDIGLDLRGSIKQKWKWIAAGAVFLAVVAILLALFLKKPAVSSQTKEGIQHLQELEAKNMDAIEQEIKQIKQEARAKAIAEGTLSVWAQFSDYVIFGDSRTVGFYFYDFLEQQRVLADGGLTIADVDTYLEQIKLLNPTYLYLCTGLNDVSIGYWPTPEEYVAAYEELMQRLMSELPNTHILINSIFPAQDPAFEESSDWRKIPEYNAAVKAWAEEKGYPYIDNTQVYEEHKDLYDPDGIHFMREFYEYWAVNMLVYSTDLE